MSATPGRRSHCCRWLPATPAAGSVAEAAPRPRSVPRARRPGPRSPAARGTPPPSARSGRGGAAGPHSPSPSASACARWWPRGELFRNARPRAPETQFRGRLQGFSPMYGAARAAGLAMQAAPDSEKQGNRHELHPKERGRSGAPFPPACNPSWAAERPWSPPRMAGSARSHARRTPRLARVVVSRPQCPLGPPSRSSCPRWASR